MEAYRKLNLYDSFAVKAVRKNSETVGYLPRELLQITIFFWDRGVSMHVKLPSRHYRRLPLVQGGMEIPCTVFFSMPSTLKNAQLAERYLQLVKQRYSEPATEKLLGSFTPEVLSEPPTSRIQEQPKECNGAKKKQKDSQPNQDTRQMFQAAAQKNLVIL